MLFVVIHIHPAPLLGEFEPTQQQIQKQQILFCDLAVHTKKPTSAEKREERWNDQVKHSSRNFNNVCLNVAVYEANIKTLKASTFHKYKATATHFA